MAANLGVATVASIASTLTGNYTSSSVHALLLRLRRPAHPIHSVYPMPLPRLSAATCATSWSVGSWRLCACDTCSAISRSIRTRTSPQGACFSNAVLRVSDGCVRRHGSFVACVFLCSSGPITAWMCDPSHHGGLLVYLQPHR